MYNCTSYCLHIVLCCVDGSDYNEREGTVTFEPGVDRLLFHVRIIEDCLWEDNERFTVHLSTGDPDVTTGGPTTVVIVNSASESKSHTHVLHSLCGLSPPLVS